ncbi:MAG: type II toxin-antitoxin system VapC family toxin [Candidatus Amesbacteria bacterium]|nr:type II toxin-antitoxin system VapC family toxin [Candidatus Amesbacteria bacterium]
MGQKIYLDTNLYIAFFEGGSGVSKKVEKLLIDSSEDNTEIVASPLLTMELLVAPLREKHEQLINIYGNLQNHVTYLNMVNFSPEVSYIAAELRAKYSLPTPDCIHLATAINEKVSIFYTADKGIAKVREIKVKII